MQTVGNRHTDRQTDRQTDKLTFQITVKETLNSPQCIDDYFVNSNNSSCGKFSKIPNKKKKKNEKLNEK